MNIFITLGMGFGITFGVVLFAFLVANRLLDRYYFKRLFYKLFKSNKICLKCNKGKVYVSAKDVSRCCLEFAIKFTYYNCSYCDGNGFINFCSTLGSEYQIQNIKVK